MRNRHLSKRRGFTLVEVLIVVVILGILAATVLPQFNQASDDAKESALIQDLQTLRSQIQLYRFQHNGAFPAAASTDASLFVDQLTKATDAAGSTSATVKPYGPYLVGQLPVNPYNGSNVVSVVNSATLPAADGLVATGGWIYSAVSGVIKANTTGTASNGVAFEAL